MKKILIIEDNNEVRENLAEILMLSDFEVVEAENGKVGVQKVKESLPDLILCDVMMPELDGFGVLKILNRSPEYMHIPFMFLTAKAEKTDFRKGMGLGADDYITKPFDDVELLDAIEMRLKKSEKLQAIDNSPEGVSHFFDEAKGEKALEALSEDREIRKYGKKETIYDVEQYPKYMFYLVKGQVKLYQTNDFGKDYISNVYGKGDFFGFLPILQGGTYDHTAMTTEDSVVKLIPAEDFKLLLHNDRDFSATFIKMLSNHASHSEAQLIDLAYSSVRKKLAKSLLSLAEKTGSESFEMMREDLASMAGTAKETTIRTLSDFKSEGIISVDGSKITILSREKLENMPQ